MSFDATPKRYLKFQTNIKKPGKTSEAMVAIL
jgi:hypothetical protein